jgi:YD repeat-containing protein
MSADIEPVGFEAEYAYDASGRLAGVRSGENAVTYRYGPSGDLAGASVVGGVEPAETVAPSPAAARFCMKCGTPAGSGDRFCLKCGAVVD